MSIRSVTGNETAGACARHQQNTNCLANAGKDHSSIFSSSHPAETSATVGCNSTGGSGGSGNGPSGGGEICVA
jgi:hypothetical protein